MFPIMKDQHEVIKNGDPENKLINQLIKILSNKIIFRRNNQCKVENEVEDSGEETEKTDNDLLKINERKFEN